MTDLASGSSVVHNRSMEKQVALMDTSAVRTIAESVAKSGLFSDIKTADAAFALMMLCQAEGLHPMQAVRRYHIINGKPAMKADAMLAEFQDRGGVVEWRQHDSDACEGVFTCPGVKTPVVVRWTMDDAQTAGVTGNPTWKKYPRQMLRARVISEGVRMTMPGVVVGLYTPEEVGDFDDKRPPAPETAPAPAPSVYTPPAKKASAAPPKAPTPVASPSANETRVELAESAPALDSKPAETTGGDASFDPIAMARGVFGMAPEVKRDPRRIDRIRALATAEHPSGLSWPRPQAANWVMKHFGAELTKLTDDQQWCAEELLRARLSSEDTYNTMFEKFVAEGRAK